MGLIRNKLQNMIDNTNLNRYNDTIAEITSYDNTRNVASIRFVNPNSGIISVEDEVPLRISGGGLIQAAPEIGQKCWITFIGGNSLNPVITNMCDDLYYDNVYSKKTNSDQGAYIINNSIRSLDINSITVIPMVDDYFNDAGSDKYSLITKDFTDIDAMQEARYLLITMDKYKPTEDGITNTKNKSNIKFKDNGDIDMFVTNNIGIRICPHNKTIEFYGLDLLFNGVSLKDYIVENMSEYLCNCNNVGTYSNIEIDDILKTNEVNNLFKKIDDYLEELKLCIKYTIQITGDSSKFLALNSKIKKYERLKEEYNTKINNNNIDTEYLQKTYDTLLDIDKEFSKELSEAKGIVEV